MDRSAYVFLVSSEEFFYFWMRDMQVYIKEIITIGNLSKNEAEKYFYKYTAENNINLKITFENLFRITGICYFVCNYVSKFIKRRKYESNRQIL